ncbi:guanine nucleotide-binding protein g(o) subunit alpha [Anaeramoeba flamelloides]|uniref:Guanine nucleotide-binding protein g(O) subunit alpha n=1 Tax=Anaeramoeba flamelloides TaxID=1746091 RepID=A0ABQ8Y933_9EUKA|nr:guanine nucleotide-binding protein g(o) subunit alpha [Anaeramoeba flamelloides]
MGNRNSNKKKNKKEKKKNAKVEKQLQGTKEQQNNLKLLILGTGESGKSTFLKQITLIHSNGFDKTTRDLYRQTIQLNLVKDTKILVDGLLLLSLDLEPENISLAKEFMSTQFTSCNSETTELIDTIKTLWSDSAMKECFENKSQLQLPDTHGYYLENIDRITSEDYIPTDQDILLCRIPTTGVNIVNFKMEEQMWNIVDVGGQRSERRKWIHHFDDVSIIVYVVAINEYDQQLFEELSINRLKESLGLFESTANNEHFENKNCVILFNKIDLFEEKIKKVSFSEWFPDFNGNEKDVNETREFIVQQFIETAKNTNRKIIHHFTCGTDTENIKNVFEEIQKYVVKNTENSNL